MKNPTDSTDDKNTEGKTLVSEDSDPAYNPESQ